MKARMHLMDGTGEHHSEWGQPGTENQKSYVLPHMQTLDLGQMQQCGWTGTTWQGESTYGKYGNREKTQNMNAFDVPTPEELIQKP
jgi:hypothetical protein